MIILPVAVNMFHFDRDATRNGVPLRPPATRACLNSQVANDGPSQKLRDLRKRRIVTP